MSSKPLKKPGHFEEQWIEENLMMSYQRSGGENGNALGTVQGAEEMKAGTASEGCGPGGKRSALDIFGISRAELSKVGLTDKKSQDRVYRTLTIWSSSMYDSLYTIANGKKEIASRLWNAYTRLADVVNPNTSISNNEIRKEFEASLKTLNESLEKNEMHKEEQQTSYQSGLKELSSTKDSLSKAEEVITSLKQQLADANMKMGTLSTDWMQVKATCEDRDKQIVELNGEKIVLNNEMNIAKNSLAVVTEELNKKKKEIMKYVEMYMKADNDMKANESITSDATQEKDRMKTKLAQYLKDNSDLQDKVKALEQAKIEGEGAIIALKKSEKAIRETKELSDALVEEMMPKYSDLAHILSESEAIMMDIVGYCEGHFSESALVDNSSAGKFKTSGSNNAQHLALMKYQLTTQPSSASKSDENRYYLDCLEWVKKVSSTTEMIDRDVVKHDLEVLEKNIEMHVSTLEATADDHNSAIQSVYAGKVISDMWMNQYMSTNTTVVAKIEEIKELKDKIEEGIKEKEAVEAVVKAKEWEIAELKKIEQKYYAGLGEMKSAIEQKDSALLKYAKTSTLEKEVEELHAIVYQLKESNQLLSTDVAQFKNENCILEHNLNKKEKICDLGNAASVAFLNVFAAVQEENKLQLQAFKNGLSSIAHGNNVNLLEIKQSPHFHHKRDVINDMSEEVLTFEERALIDKVISNVEEIWPNIVNCMAIADETISLKSSVAELTHELDSLKQWAQKERKRQTVILDEMMDKSRAERARALEDTKQLNNQIKKHRLTIDLNQGEKQKIFDQLKEVDQNLQKKKQELSEIREEYNIPEPEPEEKEEEEEEEVVEGKDEEEGIDWDAISDVDDSEVEVRAPEGAMPSNKSPRPGH